MAEKTKGDTAKKEKKKKTHQKYQKDNTPVTKSNTEPPARRKQKDLSQITYFSRKKKGYYSKDCTKLKPKNYLQSWQSLCW